MSGTARVVPGIDRAAFSVALATRLRERGARLGITAMQDLVRAITAAPPGTRSELYWTTRICLVRRRDDLALFDTVFEAVFADAVLPLDPNARRRPVPAPTDGSVSGEEPGPPAPSPEGEDGPDAGLPWATLSPVLAPADDDRAAVAVPERLPAGLAGLTDVPFGRLSPRDMQLLGRWLESAAGAWPTRRSRRCTADRSGRRVALRATLARSRRTAWDPVDLVRERRIDKPRRVVMLCDVSQSMQAQATAYLHLMRALAVAVDAEVFAFATSLTRLTAVLAQRSAEDAVEQAGEKVGDRFGGTRIATNLHALLTSHHAEAVRGAIVLIGSDGWDSDPADFLAAEMARLSRRAHRVIWMNPRAGAPGYQPRVASMAAALPYCDELVPADTFASLLDVLDALSSTTSRGSRGGSGRR